MSDLPNPRLLIHGVPLDSRASDPVAALADLTIKWGQETLTDRPTPATLNVRLRYRGSVDVLRVKQGDLIEVQQDHPDDMRSAFSGRIRNMSSHLDDRGRLHLTITATDHLADLDNTFISTAWHSDDTVEAQGTTYIQHLMGAMTSKGWEVIGLDTIPPEVGDSAAAFYSSIKLTTLWTRYLAQHGPQAIYWDASYTSDSGTGLLYKRLAVGHMADYAPGDVLTAPTGTWTLDYTPPSPLQEVTIPAGNVLRDIDWESTPENLMTAARVSFHRTRREERDDGTTGWVTSLDDTNVSRGQTWEENYGVRTVEVETCTFRRTPEGYDLSIYRPIGLKWMQYNGDEWRPGEVTIKDSGALPPQLLSDMVGKSTRPRMWLTIPGVQVMTPRGALADLRGLVTGGQLAWNGPRNRWDISFTLTDTRISGATDWRFTDIAAHNNTAVSQATAADAGTVQFSAFDTVTTIQ